MCVIRAMLSGSKNESHAHSRPLPFFFCHLQSPLSLLRLDAALCSSAPALSPILPTLQPGLSARSLRRSARYHAHTQRTTLPEHRALLGHRANSTERSQQTKAVGITQRRVCNQSDSTLGARCLFMRRHFDSLQSASARWRSEYKDKRRS